jgi:hypothetical protein
MDQWLVLKNKIGGVFGSIKSRLKTIKQVTLDNKLEEARVLEQRSSISFHGCTFLSTGYHSLEVLHIHLIYICEVSNLRVVFLG